MEFHEKLQELRKQKGLTQEELAEVLFVSRSAVSKWESNRGYPNIESLKAIANFFKVSVDALLSGEELLTISEADSRKKGNHFRDLVFGLLDLSVMMLAFLPFFGQNAQDMIQGVSLLSLTGIGLYLRIGYYIAVAVMFAVGVLSLALQNCERPFWLRNKYKLSLFLNTAGALLFVISRQPYAASFLLLFLIIKALMLIKWK